MYVIMQQLTLLTSYLILPTWSRVVWWWQMPTLGTCLYLYSLWCACVREVSIHYRKLRNFMEEWVCNAVTNFLSVILTYLLQSITLCDKAHQE